ncbi:uncharacterized protein LY89DRAFT_618155 [Mollisia scopiformis]|uniref:Uncharacterized protein n=1 Tax=Mollisia scopiformis TaxID=149040 RepID=A0A194X765_MOLSC|nr:uncharacterized protein LY89DRAFT_618155 [Mollisia scopiformis]KUJ15657.1 hypothetical protein LY89DRAFT_618155 [Mollisia scopiformis]
MFSPSQNGSAPAPTVRTSRRRPRPSGDSIAPPKAKRQRSTLTESTFVAPDAAPEMEEVTNQKVAALTKHENMKDAPAPSKEIAVRGGKKTRSTDRGSKGDGSVVLTTNDTYTVSKLPALPDRLRADAAGRQHGAIYSDSGYALTLTHTHAIVWPYAVNLQSPETFTFALPLPSKHSYDPLPLGSLVSASASSSDPGLVVVIPTTGKITYWESISSAATLDLRLQRNGVDYTIQGMQHSETVVQILNAESAGFVLAFSTGRIAYMSVRDGQGRPAIAVQFLRSNNGTGAGGIFGSLRNVLSSSNGRGDIAAIRAARPDKVGERTVISATAKGKLQSWNIQRGGHATLNAEAEGREAIVMAIKHTSPALSELLLETFELLDFSYTPRSVKDSQLSDRDDGAHLLLLTSMTDRHDSHYFLIELVLSRDNLEIGTIRPVKSYKTPVSRIATTKPRLYLPNPALVAYLVFDRAVVVVSMAKQPDSPDLQLRSESHLSPLSFEDVVDFREDMNVEIVGSGMEEPQAPSHGIEDPKSRRHKAKHPAVVLMVRGGGVVRVAATDITRLTSSRPQQVTAKSKLEQAVFFGTLDQNPLSFAVRPELQFSGEEVGEAALELSLDISKSETPYIPSVPASVEQNLRKRSAALRDLAKYLKASAVVLDRTTKWKLLWAAEKMTAASSIWKLYDASLKEKSIGQKRGLLTEVVEFIHEDYKTEPVSETGELDRVRHWFIKDVWNLEIAIPWAYQVIKYTYQDGKKGHDGICALLSEGDDMVLGALQAAFDFRTANLDLYGLGDEKLEHGILKVGYEGLPEFWTSTIFTTENIRKQAELAGMLLKGYWDKENIEGEERPHPRLVNKVRLEFPDLLDITIRATRERIRWDLCQEGEPWQSEAERIAHLLDDAQQRQIADLAEDLQLPDAAANLAEKHELLPSLAMVLQYGLNVSSAKTHEKGISKEEKDLYTQQYYALRERVRRCFEKFGSAWATALFEVDIRDKYIADLFDGWPEQQDYLTAFLHRDEYAKLSWINDITREDDFDHASKTLLKLGLTGEDDLWSKQVELSIGKLALLANKSPSQANEILSSKGGKSEVSSAQNQLGLIKIQQTIFNFILPSIESAIDERAELQLALESFGNNELIKQPQLLALLKESMDCLIKHKAMKAPMLIDLLTLMGGNGSFEELSYLHSQQFYLALKAARYGLEKKDEQILTQRIIWKRCMLRDDWAEINNTVQKDDQQVSEQLARTALYQTFRQCLKDRLFDKRSVIKPMSPEEVLGAGSEGLDPRFTVLDASIREQIVQDMLVEDDALKHFIEKCRLDQWYDSALTQAKDDYDSELNEETDDGGKMNQIAAKLVDLEEEIKESEMKKAESLLHSKPRYKPKPKVNGSVGNFRSSFRP